MIEGEDFKLNVMLTLTGKFRTASYTDQEIGHTRLIPSALQ